MFGLDETITLYDLTNTYFEGEGENNESAKHGRSKEKRFDCPLVTLVLLLDGSDFPKKKQDFSRQCKRTDHSCRGNFPKTKPTIVMDAGLATEANILWLTERGYHYVVVSRKQHREFSEEGAVLVKDEGQGKVQVQRVVNEETK